MGEIKINPLFNVHQNYNKVNIVNPYRFTGGGGASYEPETVAYMASVGIADDATVYYSGTAQEKTGNGFYVAVDNYIKSLKTAGVFSKLKAVYPMIGGNASTHKWNLINPQDTDAAHRMLWYGSGVHSATGFKGNGTNAYGDTKLNQSLHSALGNESFGIYSRTELDANVNDIGIAVSPVTSMTTKAFNRTYFSVQGLNNSSPNASSLGFHSITANPSTIVLRQRGTVVSFSLTPTGLSNSTFAIGATKVAGGANNFSSRELSYSFISEGLTETQMTAHYNAVQQLQTDLGRAV